MYRHMVMSWHFPFTQVKPTKPRCLGSRRWAWVKVLCSCQLAAEVQFISDQERGSETVSLASRWKTKKTTEATSCDQAPVHIIDPVLQKLPTDVTPNQRERIVDLLEEFDDMFLRGTYDRGRTNLVERTIDTGVIDRYVNNCVVILEHIWTR